MSEANRPAYVRNMRTRHGKPIRYLRIKGRNICRLPVLPYGSPEFRKAYEEALGAFYSGRYPPKPIGIERTKPGSISALIVAWYGSAEYRTLAPTTQRTYRGIIERFREKYGDLPVRGLERKHILAILDKRSATPAAANNLLKIIRILLRFGMERGWRTDDPTIGVKPLKMRQGGFHTWTDEEIAAFEARWPLGTRERLALDLLLYTAQRSGDVRVIGRQHVRDGRIVVRQEKTKELLEIPIHPALQASLNAGPTGELTFLVTQFGKPYSAAGFGNFFSDAARKAGLPKGCSAHGLRKAAARRLAEAGCSAHEIMAVTGHRTLKEVTRYTAAADQRRLAETALDALGRRSGKNGQ